LTALGHRVEVIAGPPYPVVDDDVALTRLPGLELFAEPNPFRTPRWAELRAAADWAEYLDWRLRGHYSEPLAFSLRALAYLRSRRSQFDIVHDNQCLGYGLLGLRGLPVVATVHHPIAIDRDITLAATTGSAHRGAARWYGFTGMQHRVVRRLPAVLTVSEASRAALQRHMRVPADRITVAAPGVDRRVFRPDPAVPRVPGRVVATASADVPLKGLDSLLHALTLVPQAHLVLVGTIRPESPAGQLIERLGDRVTVQSGLSDDDLAALLRSAQVACVPSLFEGFALPAVEAMACGTPLVVTDVGALPEVVGPHGECALLTPAGDVSALSANIRIMLANSAARDRMGANGATRAAVFSWRRTAAATEGVYRTVLSATRSVARQRNGVPC
jgi:glycosyltransferase involved in cell wall biosynthesis